MIEKNGDIQINKAGEKLLESVMNWVHENGMKLNLLSEEGAKLEITTSDDGKIITIKASKE